MLGITLIDSKNTQLDIAKSGYTLRGFSRHIGISSGYLSEVLKERKAPSPVVAQKIASGLNKKVDDIFLFEMVDTANIKREANHVKDS